jgi:hypothetical protein
MVAEPLSDQPGSFTTFEVRAGGLSSLASSRPNPLPQLLVTHRVAAPSRSEKELEAGIAVVGVEPALRWCEARPKSFFLANAHSVANEELVRGPRGPIRCLKAASLQRFPEAGFLVSVKVVEATWADDEAELPGAVWGHDRVPVELPFHDPRQVERVGPVGEMREQSRHRRPGSRL